MDNKTQAQPGETPQERIQSIIEKTETVLFKATSVFPFDFFPDDIIIDENKVNVINRQFFLSEDVHSVLIRMIRDISVESSVFFATMKIVPEGFDNKPIIIRYLTKGNAFKARRIIHGLMTFIQEKNILPSAFSPQIKYQIERAGRIPAIGFNA